MNQGKQLEEILHKKGITIAEFARKMDITRQAVYSYTKTKAFHPTVLSKIIDTLGISEEDFNEIQLADEPKARYGSSNVAFYNSAATMTVTENWPDTELHPSFQASIPGYEGCIGVQAFGDSMYPTFVSGCWVLCREIKDRDTILYGECYLVMTSDYLVIKRIFKSENEDSVYLSSDNYHAKDEDRKRYAPIELPKSKILKLWIIRGALKKFEI